MPVSAIEFYSASRKVPVSSIIEFIKMLIEYTITKTTQLGETSAIDITYQLINKRESKQSLILFSLFHHFFRT